MLHRKNLAHKQPLGRGDPNSIVLYSVLKWSIQNLRAALLFQGLHIRNQLGPSLLPSTVCKFRGLLAETKRFVIICRQHACLVLQELENLRKPDGCFFPTVKARELEANEFIEIGGRI